MTFEDHTDEERTIDDLADAFESEWLEVGGGEWNLDDEIMRETWDYNEGGSEHE